MSRYHCLYCAPAPAYHRSDEQGVQVCGYCGDPLVRIPRFQLRQLAALVAVGAFLAPLLSLIWFSLQGPDQRRAPERQDRVAMTWVADCQAPLAS